MDQGRGYVGHGHDSAQFEVDVPFPVGAGRFGQCALQIRDGTVRCPAGDAAGMRRVFCEQLATDAAQAALDDLARFATGCPTCLLCFCRDPTVCHRRVIAERLRPQGFTAQDLFA